MSWPIGPDTSIVPASPARPPLSSRQSQMILVREKPAKRAAAGAWPTTLISKPMIARAISTHAPTATAIASSAPRCSACALEDDRHDRGIGEHARLREAVPFGVLDGP